MSYLDHVAISLLPDQNFKNGAEAYEHGEYSEALQWFRKAAEQGDDVAQYNLGTMYYNGDGVPQDYGEAVQWFRKAAEQGDDLAQFSLGTMYQDGLGLLQDYVSAYTWFNFAAAQGLEEAATDRDHIARSMTASDISQAQRLAREWLKKHGK